MKFRSRSIGFTPRLRVTAALQIPLVLLTLAWPRDFFAQTFRSFEQSREQVDRYVDRATRLENEAAWTNYVDLGIATERVQWEQEAFEVLAARERAIAEGTASAEQKAAEVAAARAELEQAAADWDEAAETFVATERGAFRAQQEAGDIEVGAVADEAYLELIAAAEAAVADSVGVDLAGWEAAIATGHAAITGAFESALSGELADARAAGSALDGAELASFEAELGRVEAEMRAEFQTRDNFFVARARNRYIALKRGDELSAKLAAGARSAEAVGEQIVADTLAALDKDTADLLNAARTEMENLTADPDSPDFSAAGLAWEQRMEAVIDAGLRAWERSEEDLYQRRLEWTQSAEATREEGGQIWQTNHESLKQARDEWLAEIQVQIKAGRQEWENKIGEFRENREQAEVELAEYIASERTRRDAVGQELSGIVNGGGSALLEAKDAYRYYDSLIKALQPPGGGAPAENLELYNFYLEQRDIMSRAVGSYQNILAGSENVLYQSMHSGEDHTGFLADVRLFAGTLKTDVLALDADDFEAELQALIDARGEDFTLYRRDIEDLISQNGLFHERALELSASAQFDYNAAADRTALKTLVAGIDRKYDEHRDEIEARLAARESAFAAANDTGAADYAANLLAALKTEIADWTALATDRDAHLQATTTRYFNEGLGGFYLTDNEGDPYYMSQAEYTWELLRRERNYLAKELERAEAVKEYADLAFQFEAGIEMAAITRERADVAKVKQDLKEISFLLLQGQIATLPAAYTDDAVRDAEFQRVLAERGVDPAALLARKATLEQERALLAGVPAAADTPDADEAESLRAELDAYLNERFGADAANSARAEHPFARLRDKVAAYRQRALAGADAATLADEWKTLRGALGAARSLLDDLNTEYGFAELEGELTDLRTRQMRMPTIGDLRADLGDLTGQIQANAELLGAARDRLEEAKTAYRQARLDFDIIRAGNSEDLIKNDVINNTAALAGVIQRMQKIESIVPLFGGEDLDALGAQRLTFSAEVSERERAENDARVAGAALTLVEGLTLARARTAALENLLAGVAGKSPSEIADLFINAKNDLVKTDAGDEERALNSEEGAAQAMATLEAGQARIAELKAELDEQIADGASANELAYRRAGIATLEETLLRTAESLSGAIRGEERARSEHLLYFLKKADGGGDVPDPTAQIAALEARLEADQNAARDLARSAAERLAGWLESNHTDGTNFRTYAELVDVLNAAIGTREFVAQNGYGGAAGTNDTDRAELGMLREWLLANRTAIEAATAAPGTNAAGTDARAPADKWNALLAGASALADTHAAYAEFEASLPDAVSDAWAVSYRATREALRVELEGVLARPDAELAGALNTLNAASRELLLNYGGWRDGDLRNSIEESLANVEQTLAATTSLNGVRQAYRAERARETMGQMAALEPALNADAAELYRQESERGAATSARDALQAKLNADASRTAELQPQIDAAQAKINALDASTNTLRAGLEARQIQYARLAAVAGEALEPGSSLKFFDAGQATMHEANQRLATSLWLVSLMKQDEPAAQTTTESEELLGLIGYYRTDRRGNVLRDGDGKALVNADFLGGIIDPDQDVFAQIAGDRKGEELAAWAGALTTALNDETKSKGLSAETRAAAGMLEDALRQMIVAERLIQLRDRTANEIEGEGRELKTTAKDSLAKLNQVLALEDALKTELQKAATTGQDQVRAALAVLETPANLRVLRLFEGYDASGKADGVADEAAQAKLNELKQLAADMRELRIQTTVQNAGTSYAQILNSYVAAAGNPYAYAPDRDAFVEAQVVFDAAAVNTALDAVAGGAGYRERLETWLGSAPGSMTLYKGTLYDLLSTSASDGDTLKTEVAAAVNALEIRLNDETNALLAQAEDDANRDANIEVTTSVTALIEAYATRGTKARDELGPVVDGIAEATSLNTARATVETKIAALETETQASAMAGIYRETRRIMDEAPDTLALKINLTNYLNTLTDPEATDLTTLGDELHARELNRSVAQFDASGEYNPADYPEELRELILTRGYQQAAARYTEYRDARGSDLASIRESATLDLSGINGALAEHFLLTDYNEWASTHTLADYRTNATAPDIAGYLAAYYADRKTGPDRLPNGAAILYEQVALAERARLETAITATGIQAIDERTFLNDFRDQILVRKFQDYKNTSGLTLTGATGAEKVANFERDFDTYLAGSVGTRLLDQDARENYFISAYQHMVVGLDANTLLPGALLERYTEGRLDEPFDTTRLPDELVAISDYATTDYRTKAASVSAKTAATLARIETTEAWTTMQDADLNAILTRAGYDTADATLQSELTTYIGKLNTAAKYNGAQTVDEALAGLRQTKALETLLPTTAERRAFETFLAGESETLNRVAEKYNAALNEAHADIQRLAGEQAGATFAMLTEGPTHPLYGTQSANVRAAIDTLRTEYLATLSTEEQTAITTRTGDYAKAMELQNEQALATSGVFTAAAEALDATARRSGVHLNQDPAGMRALIESLYANEGIGALSAESASYISTNGLSALMTKTINEMEPALKEALLDQPVLINRMLANYLETTAERAEITALFNDPATLNPDANLALDYELTKNGALIANEQARLTTALARTVDDHRRGYAELDRKYRRDGVIGEELITFAQARGDDPITSRYSNYRTYIGIEEAYVPGTQAEREANRVYLEHTSLGLTGTETILDAGTYKDLITSDSAAAGRTVTAAGGGTYETKTIKTVSGVNAVDYGDDNAAQMRHTYHENLANNYLEAISNLNSVLNNVWKTAQLAENRKAEEATFKTGLATAYDPNDLTAAKAALTAKKVDAESRKAAHSDAKIQEAQDGIGATKTALTEAARDYAGAGRRNQLRNMALTAYLEQVYRGIADEMDAAEQEYNTLSGIASGLRTEYTTKNQQYAGALEDLAQRGRELDEKADAYTTRVRVQEYAETPYLYAKSEDASGGEPDGKVLEEWHGDAEEEYERAKTMLTAAQTRLNEAAYEVQTEDRLPEFMNVVALWEAGGRVDLAALTVAEQTTLATLRDRKYNKHETLDMTDANILQQLEERDLFTRNRELITTRAEHIKHTMRLVRISKAKELIEAEITRRRMIAQEKEAQFQRELSARFKVDETQAAGVEARNAVYARMAMLVETGGSFYNEFKSWYWGSREYISDFAGANASTALGSLFATTNLTITMNQILEGMSGQWMAGDKSVADKTMIGKWMGMGGEIAEYGGFRQLYFQFMLSIGIWDQKRLEYQITKTTWDPVSQAGQRLIDAGNRIPFGAGGGLVSMGRGMKGQASTEIMKALLQYQIAEYIMRRQYNGANEMADRARSNTIRVMEAQKEYEDALAELYYFTRVPDAKTLKERMIQYGAQNQYEAAGPGDPTTGALYGLTEEDLAYMFDDAGYVDSNGNTYDPEDRDVDEAEMLNVTGLKYEVEYRDAFGRRYDPGVQTGGQPGALEGGWYKGGDGNYTRIRISNHNRSKEYRYNRSIAEDADGHMVYDMGTVLESAMAHAENLRADRAAKYTAAGNAVAAANGDEHFTFSERDKTYGDLFNSAAGYANGGREFSGYRVTYEDYLNNSMAVQDRELGQRQNVQLKDWQLKETELMQQYQNWEDRTATILERGKRGWSDAESQYLQQWRQWERETDQEIAAAKKEWDAKVKEHFENKQEWETKVRSEASEATIKTVLGQAVDSLNAQLSASAGNVGMIDRTAAIAQAIDEMRQSMPSGAENLKSINKNIQNFNTTLSIAEMIGANVEADLIDVSGRFRAQMEEQQESMKILANVKIFEQYRQLIEDFKYSITVQNEEIEAQTMAAALGEGYQRQGDIYVKQGDASSSYGIVNAYKWFDVDNAMDSELGKTGFTAMKGNDLVNFLKGRSNTEVEAYFYTQKLAVQTAIGNIQGHGTGDQRSWATDAHTLGLFGHWVGRASNSMGDSSGLPIESLMTRAAGSGEDRDPEQIANAVAMMGAGFGELGAFSQRPGGAPLGFYPQLGVMSRYVQKTDNEWIANGKAFRRAERFETPGDLKGDAFDRMNAKMKEVDELNSAWKQNDGDLTKMWKQGYLDSYDTGLMKHSDFSTQQGAYQDKYGFLQKQPSASERAMEQLGKKAVEVGAKSVTAMAQTQGAIARMATNPTDPGAWVQMFSSMASSAGQVYGAMTSFAGDALSMGGAGGIGATLRGAGAQLEAAGQQIGAAGDHLALELELSNDPISGLMRQFDPVRMIKNSVWNTELAAQMDGKGRGYMAEAQLINVVKQPLAIAGSMLVAAGVGAGSTGVGSVPGAIVAAIGAAVVTLANSTHVDVRTGERSVKMTDEAALQSAIAILTAVVGGAAAQGAAAGATAGTTAASATTAATQTGLSMGQKLALDTATNLLSNMVNVNQKGEIHGLKTGAEAEAALIRTTFSMGGTLAAGAMGGGGGAGGGSAFMQGFTNNLVSGAIGKGAYTAGEYLIQQTYGSKVANGLEATRRTDLGAGLGMALSAVLAGVQAQNQAGEMDDLRSLADAGDKEAQDILNGMVIATQDRRRKLLSGEERGSGLSFLADLVGWESAANWLDSGVYSNNGEIGAAMSRVQQAGAGNMLGALLQAQELVRSGKLSGEHAQLALQGFMQNRDITGIELLRMGQARIEEITGKKATNATYDKLHQLLQGIGDGAMAKFGTYSLAELEGMLGLMGFDTGGPRDWNTYNAALGVHTGYGQQADAEVRAGLRDQYTGAWIQPPADPQQQAAENNARVAEDARRAQEYLDNKPWYAFANVKDFLTRYTGANKGNLPGFGDLLKAAFTSDNSPNVAKARDGFTSFYSALSQDLGIGVSRETVGSIIGNTGKFANMLAGPDMEATGEALSEADAGNYQAATGYGALAIAGILLNKVKAGGKLGKAAIEAAPGGKTALKWISDALAPGLKKVYDKTVQPIVTWSKNSSVLSWTKIQEKYNVFKGKLNRWGQSVPYDAQTGRYVSPKGHDVFSNKSFIKNAVTGFGSGYGSGYYGVGNDPLPKLPGMPWTLHVYNIAHQTGYYIGQAQSALGL